MLVSRCWSNVFLRRLVKCVCFKVFEKMFILGFLVKCLFNCFVPSFFSIFILFLFTYPPRCHSRWDRPHGPSSNSDPSSLLVGHTVQVTTQYTLHSWPHSTGKPHSTHYNVGHTVKVISPFCSYLTSVDGIVEVILDRWHSFGDVVLHSWYFLQ